MSVTVVDEDVVLEDLLESIHNETAPAFDIIGGHYSFGLHNAFKNAVYLTFLRDPVDRVLSHFFHIYCTEFVEDVGAQTRQADDITTFLARRQHHELDNLMTRMISGVGNEVPPGQLTGDHLALALDNVYRFFSFVGFVEDYPNSVWKLQDVLGMPRTMVPYLNLGVARGTYAIGDAERSKIAATQFLDVELYQTLDQTGRRLRPTHAKQSLADFIDQATVKATENLDISIRALREDSLLAYDVIDRQQCKILTVLISPHRP